MASVNAFLVIHPASTGNLGGGGSTPAPPDNVPIPVTDGCTPEDYCGWGPADGGQNGVAGSDASPGGEGEGSAASADD